LGCPGRVSSIITAKLKNKKTEAKKPRRDWREGDEVNRMREAHIAFGSIQS
jgi:hypothetical protein